MKRNPLILAFESSADDSSCALLAATRPPRILSLHSIHQHTTNAAFGGIHPLHAQAQHVKNLPAVLRKVTGDYPLARVDAFAYTRGPGMRGCLHVGEMMAKSLAAGLGKPLQAHALTPLLTETTPPAFPFLVLLLSGGHTQLVLAEGSFKFRILLDALDSKIGDVYEKAARLIQLPTADSALGAVLENYASMPSLLPYSDNPLPALPIPLSVGDSKFTMAFSFSGILSSLSRVLAATTTRPGEAEKREFSRILQNAVVSHLTFKLTQAIQSLPKATLASLSGIAVSGGVASNRFVRLQLRDMLDNKLSQELGRSAGLWYPPINLCTDNAAMIAHTALIRFQPCLYPTSCDLTNPPPLVSDPFDLPLRPKWSLEALYDDVPASAHTGG
nr:hypothetical protein L204_00021 [Cryptococcus depauperatus CBS 7855]